jgi:hypothetical protein
MIISFVVTSIAGIKQFGAQGHKNHKNPIISDFYNFDFVIISKAGIKQLGDRDHKNHKNLKISDF